VERKNGCVFAAVAILALVASISGCVGAKPEAKDSARPAPDGTGVRLFRSGTPRDATSEETWNRTTISVDGTTGRFVCAWIPSVTGQCQILNPPNAGHMANQRGKDIYANVSWQPLNPATEALSVGIFECGQTCQDSELRYVAHAYGPSPLRLHVETTVPNFSIWIYYGVSFPPAPVYVRPVDQPFKLEGSALVPGVSVP